MRASMAASALFTACLAAAAPGVSVDVIVIGVDVQVPSSANPTGLKLDLPSSWTQEQIKAYLATRAAPMASPMPPAAPYECDCAWIDKWHCPTSAAGASGPFARNDGSACFQYCCRSPPAPPAPMPSAPLLPAIPPSPPLPPAIPYPPSPPICNHCDAGTECGYCLVLLPNCPYWGNRKLTCGPDTLPGEWCDGDETCGTDNPKNGCFFGEEVYTRVDCGLPDPPQPSPSPPPRPDLPPGDVIGESGFLTQDLQGQEAGKFESAWYANWWIWYLLAVVLLGTCFAVAFWMVYRARLLDSVQQNSKYSAGNNVALDLGTMAHSICDTRTSLGLEPVRQGSRASLA
jgi:hypothetical protein